MFSNENTGTLLCPKLLIDCSAIRMYFKRYKYETLEHNWLNDVSQHSLHTKSTFVKSLSSIFFEPRIICPDGSGRVLPAFLWFRDVHSDCASEQFTLVLCTKIKQSISTYYTVSNSIGINMYLILLYTSL